MQFYRKEEGRIYFILFLTIPVDPDRCNYIRVNQTYWRM